jgi:hypothetical protein
MWGRETERQGSRDYKGAVSCRVKQREDHGAVPDLILFNSLHVDFILG